MMDSFAEVEAWLRGLPDQKMGNAGAVCETGKPYEEFSEISFARPADVKIIERNVATRFFNRLICYFSNREGPIYWRMPFESEILPIPLVVRYDEAGPDIDYVTDRRCHLDHDWMKVSCYCRLYRSHIAMWSRGSVFGKLAMSLRKNHSA